MCVCVSGHKSEAPTLTAVWLLGLGPAISVPLRLCLTGVLSLHQHHIKNTPVISLALRPVLSAPPTPGSIRLPNSHFLCRLDGGGGGGGGCAAETLQKVLMDGSNCNAEESLNQGYFGGRLGRRSQTWPD